MADNQNTQLTKISKQEVAAAIGNSTIADSILKSFNNLAEQGMLVFPQGYSYGNQLKLAYTTLCQDRNIAKATPASIGQALVEMAIQGLEIDKKQLYFIVMGNELLMFRSYFGDVKVALETGLVKEIKARVIYTDDEYEMDTNEDGEEIIVNHKTKLENHDKPIVGAYAWAVYPDGRRTYCIMTKKEIDANWNKSKDPSRNVQKDFPQEMSKRTVIRRLVKMIFNTAPSALTDAQKAIIRSYNDTTEKEYVDNKPTERKSTVANIVIDDDTGVVVEEPVEEAKAEEPKKTDEEKNFPDGFEPLL